MLGQGALSVLFMSATLALGLALVWRGRGIGLSVLPLGLFAGLEIMMVWPSLVSGVDSVGGGPGLLAATALLAAVLAFFPFTGHVSSLEAWRLSCPVSSSSVKNLRFGIGMLVTALVITGLWRFQGLPPILLGFASLVDPDAAGGDAAMIRESRRSLTKGHTLMGDEYQGQGVLNNVTEAGWQLVVSVVVLLLAKRLVRRRYLGWATLGLAFVFLTSSGSRSPVVMAIGVAALTLFFSRSVPRKAMLTVAALGSGLTLLIMPLSKGADQAGGTVIGRLAALVERVGYGNGQNNVAIIRLVESGDLPIAYGGLIIERAIAMLPGVSTDTPFAFRLTQLAYGGGSNVTGYSTPTQFGLLYADWGQVGVVPGYIMTGLVIGLGWKFVLSLRHFLAPTIGSLASVHLSYISVAGIHAVLVSVLVVSALLLFVLIPEKFSTRRNQRYRLTMDPRVTGAGRARSSHGVKCRTRRETISPGQLRARAVVNGRYPLRLGHR